MPDWASGTGFVPPFKRVSLACMGTDSKEKKTGQILVGEWRFSRFPILFSAVCSSILKNDSFVPSLDAASCFCHP